MLDMVKRKQQKGVEGVSEEKVELGKKKTGARAHGEKQT
jgi:hypothetical protein